MLIPKVISPPASAYSRSESIAGTPWRPARRASWTRRALKKASTPTNRASGRSRTIVAKAASISRLVLALRTWICSPMARAAASTSLNVDSVFVAWAGLTSTTTRVAAGTSARRSSSRFALANEKIDPRQVAAGLGKAGHKTESYRVFADGEDDGDRRGCRLRCERHSGASARGDHRDPSANQFGRQCRQPIELILGPAVFDRHVLALDIAGVFEPLAKSAQTIHQRVRRPAVEHPDHRHCGLLRTRRERPGDCCAAEQRDELAPLHSITSSASPISLSGIWRPSALAVLRLMTNWNLVGSSTGRSAGLSPLRTRPV